MTTRLGYSVEPGSAEWLALRAQDVTSTEVAALYGASPYLTAFELHHRKSQAEIGGVPVTERMRWGQRLEPVIAAAAGQELNEVVSPKKDYVRIPELKAGSSFDFQTETGALLECKNVGSDRRKAWTFDGDALVEAPLHIELQVQHQMLVSGATKAYVAVLFGGNELAILQRWFDAAIGDDIKSRIHQFWEQVRAATPPSPSSADSDFILRSLRAQAGDAAIVVDSNDVAAALQEYRSLGEQIAALEERRDAAKATVLLAVGDAAKVKTPVGTVACGMTAPNPGKVITPDMVGTIIGARASYRQFRFTPSKTK